MGTIQAIPSKGWNTTQGMETVRAHIEHLGGAATIKETGDAKARRHVLEIELPGGKGRRAAGTRIRAILTDHYGWEVKDGLGAA